MSSWRRGRWLVVIRAAEVVAAVGTDELASVAGEAVTAGGADLAVMVDGCFGDAGFERVSGGRL